MKHSLYFLIAFLMVQSPRALSLCWQKPVIPQTPTTFVLAMGANIGELNKSNADAQVLAATLRERFNIPLSNTCVLENVTREHFEDNLNRLKDLARKQDQVFIYFSGHGTQIQDESSDEENCYDEALVIFNYFGSGTYFVIDDYFLSQMNEIKSHHMTTIIDSCFSGGMLRGTKNCLDMKSKLFFNEELDEVLPSKNCPSATLKEQLKGTVYMASKEHQLAWEFDQGSVFTTFFINNMRNNPKVELNQIFDMTAQQVSEKTRQGGCDQWQEPQRRP